MTTMDDDLGDLAAAYNAAVFSAQHAQQGSMPFDRSQKQQSDSIYQIENGGMNTPEGI